MRLLAALILLPLLTAGTPADCSTAVAVDQANMTADRELYRLSSDVRIKRMHLMRPDLISYPNLPDYYA